jgi:hypothetical protein
VGGWWLFLASSGVGRGAERCRGRGWMIRQIEGR